MAALSSKLRAGVDQIALSSLRLGQLSISPASLVALRESLRKVPALLPVALGVLTLLSYLPSLGGGFLNYDDPWLIRDNRILSDASATALGAIWTDFSRTTRLGLGAEYLPLRDMSHWLEFRFLGGSPQAMRLVQLALYIAAVLLLRSALARALTQPWLAEATAWLFALHPVHVESVAWLAGRKDILALLFVSAAANLHVGKSKHKNWGVPLLFALACLSKALAVASVGIFVALDLLRSRRPSLMPYLGMALVAAVTLVLHLRVGHNVGMLATHAGGTPLTAAATMGPIWLKYLWLSLWPPALSITHDVTIRTGFDALSIAGWGFVVGWAILGLWRWRRQEPMALAAWLCFAVPLAPVSQVLFPLQNLMADRYLLFSVLGCCLVAAWLLVPRGRSGHIALFSIIALVTAFTAQRAALFADSVALFQDATSKTQYSPIAPYQLGKAFEQASDTQAALAHYQETLRRQPGSGEVARRATNNAARLLVASGRLHEAQNLLERGRQLWRQDPKILANSARVSALLGDWTRACQHLEALRAHAPRYPFQPSWAKTQCPASAH